MKYNARDENLIIFIQTENLDLCVPSRENLNTWTKWINSAFVRKTVLSTKTPTTTDMQWDFIQSHLRSRQRILLEIHDRENQEFIGVISLSTIDYEARSAQIATISPMHKNSKNLYSVYEARVALLNYAFKDLNLNKVWGSMLYPDNESFLVNNMCLGFEVEGIIHDRYWHDDNPQMAVNYFMTKSMFTKNSYTLNNIRNELSKKNRNAKVTKLRDVIKFLKIN